MNVFNLYTLKELVINDKLLKNHLCNNEFSNITKNNSLHQSFLKSPNYVDKIFELFPELDNFKSLEYIKFSDLNIYYKSKLLLTILHDKIIEKITEPINNFKWIITSANKDSNLYTSICIKSIQKYSNFPIEKIITPNENIDNILGIPIEKIDMTKDLLNIYIGNRNHFTSSGDTEHLHLISKGVNIFPSIVIDNDCFLLKNLDQLFLTNFLYKHSCLYKFNYPQMTWFSELIFEVTNSLKNNLIDYDRDIIHLGWPYYYGNKEYKNNLLNSIKNKDLSELIILLSKLNLFDQIEEILQYK